MINRAEVDLLYDCEVVDEHSRHIGVVKQVWLDEKDGQPIWASIRTGLFGQKESFVPIHDATLADNVLMVPVDRQQVKNAPRLDVSDQYLSEEQQDELHAYYGLVPPRRGDDHDRAPSLNRSDTMPMPAPEPPGGTGGGTGGGAPGRTAVPERHGRHEAATDESATQYVEDLDVSARDAVFGRVRLVKHVVTEREDPSAPVSHEEVRVVLEPAEDEAEVTLPGQEPVVDELVEEPVGDRPERGDS